VPLWPFVLGAFANATLQRAPSPLISARFARHVACRAPLGVSSLRIAALTAAAFFFSESTGLANGVLAPAAQSDPSTLDLAIAVARTPYGMIRWSRVSVAGPGRVLWLVPARPGAAIDWAPQAWLDALDEATAPRVIPPTATPPGGMQRGAERGAPIGPTKHATTDNQLLC
jgi:hypothetical protein